MKRLLALAALAVCAMPALAFAAYNDVTLTTNAVISVGGYTINVSGSTATVQSIVVNSGNFSVTLASGSYLTVTSPTLHQLSSDVTTDVTSNTCTGSASSLSLAYSGGGTATNVITPSATVCTNSSSGGGGIIYGSGPLAPGYINTNPTATSTAGNAIPSSETLTSAGLAASGAATSATTSSDMFTHNLSYRVVNTDVTKLQKYLNANGFVLAQSGPGSPGEETDLFGLLTYTALVKFQDAHAAEILTPAGLTQGSGYFGPATRAFVNRH